MARSKRKNLKHSYSVKMRVVDLYSQGSGSKSISKELNISDKVVETWLRLYQKALLGMYRPKKN